MNWSCSVTQQSIEEEDLNNTGPPTVVKKGITEIFPCPESSDDVILGFPLASRSAQPTRHTCTFFICQPREELELQSQFREALDKEKGFGKSKTVLYQCMPSPETF